MSVLELVKKGDPSTRIQSAIKSHAASNDSPVIIYEYHECQDCQACLDNSCQECLDNSCQDCSSEGDSEMRDNIREYFDTASTEQDYHNIIALMTHYHESRFDNDCVKLVKYPICLDKYLHISCISLEDVAEMICQCIENDESWAEDSFKILISELENFDLSTAYELRLLCVKNPKLYEHAKQLQFIDPYYENSTHGQSYVYHGINLIDAWNNRILPTYREVFHLLMYGTNEHRQQICVYLDLAGDYAHYNVINALCNYFRLPDETPLSSLKEVLSNN